MRGACLFLKLSPYNLFPEGEGNAEIFFYFVNLCILETVNQ